MWVAEIMLQQTQVATVLKYYDRFIERFPNVVSLHRGTREEVLSAWYGLGYYRRAINMHEAAAVILQEHAGKFPRTISELSSLPGIGRSTAGSILASAWNISAPILDANVRRVLARFHGVNGPAATKVTERQLWELTESHTPKHNSRSYNQAIMDFGALWCTRTNPNCTQCPLGTNCFAYQKNQVAEFPAKKIGAPVHLTTIRPCVVFDLSFACLLRQRACSGIYAEMWDTPEITEGTQPKVLLRQLHLPDTGFTLLEGAHTGSYRISNQKITEKLTIAKYNISSIELSTPSNAQWTPFKLLRSVGLPVKTMQRIELARAVVESK